MELECLGIRVSGIHTCRTSEPNLESQLLPTTLDVFSLSHYISLNGTVPFPQAPAQVSSTAHSVLLKKDTESGQPARKKHFKEMGGGASTGGE